MALDQQSNMELEPHSPYSTSSTETASLPCEELTPMKVYIRRLQIICSEKEKTVSLLRLDYGHSEADYLYQLAWNEFQDIQATLQQTNQFSLLPNFLTRQISGQQTPSIVANTPNAATSQQPRQGNNPLPPPLMLKITANYRVQVDIKKFYPNLKLKTTGEYIKLDSDTVEQNRIIAHTLENLNYQFYVIKLKNERSIKIVIKGLPKNSNTDLIKADLKELGFLPEKVTQLIGRRTKQN
ncbi:hypothetical protein TNCV_3317121 [Trichonephila clavipes]|nr:hypothetical protein TNCV_3317121 [Trichonephila clavipes]